jgi:hypothetical protein
VGAEEVVQLEQVVSRDVLRQVGGACGACARQAGKAPANWLLRRGCCAVAAARRPTAPRLRAAASGSRRPAAAAAAALPRRTRARRLTATAPPSSVCWRAAHCPRSARWRCTCWRRWRWQPGPGRRTWTPAATFAPGRCRCRRTCACSWPPAPAARPPRLPARCALRAIAAPAHAWAGQAGLRTCQRRSITLGASPLASCLP